MVRMGATVVLALALAAGAGRDGWAWGATGHELVSGVAIEKLPNSLPAFVRSPEAGAGSAVRGREPDRPKGSGRTHDAERDPGHSIALADDGSVLGALPLDKLPPTRRE